MDGYSGSDLRIMCGIAAKLGVDKVRHKYGKIDFKNPEHLKEAKMPLSNEDFILARDKTPKTVRPETIAIL